MTKSKNLEAKKELFWNKGMQAYSNRNFLDAERNFKLYLKHDPSSFMGHYRLAMVYHEQLSLDDAIQCYGRVIELNPKFPDAFCDRGAAFVELGRTSDALADYERAIELDRNFAEAFYNQGIAYVALGRYGEAVSSFRRALFLKDNLILAELNLANTLLKLRSFDEAISIYKSLINRNPNFAAAYYNLGNAFSETDDLEAALKSFDRAIEIDKTNPVFFYNRGITLHLMHDHEGAIGSYKKAIQLKPDYADAFNNLGKVFLDLRSYQEAIDAFEKSTQFDDEALIARSNYLFSLLYADGVSAEFKLERSRAFGERASRLALSKFDHPNLYKSDKLRIGFVSGDLRRHSVAYFLDGIVSNLDKSKFELFAYANNSDDEITTRLRQHFLSFKTVTSLTDAELAQVIYSDGLHFLFDLSGHSALNRLPVFSYKPAPVQISWLGYCATTGLTEMDYILADPIAVPPEQAAHFCESILRMPDCYICYTPPDFDVAVKKLPAAINGFVTFGSFNNFSKMNDGVLSVWARILQSVDGSRLFLKSGQLASNALKNDVRRFFKAHGISDDRIDLESTKSNPIDHLDCYNRIDVALDTFPYQGVTSTMEALWMGVPVLTKKGKCFVSNNGEMIARASGQSNWVASDEEDYIRKAIELSSDLRSLANIRSGLRRKVLSSPIADAPRFVRNLEQLLQCVWSDRSKN